MFAISAVKKTFPETQLQVLQLVEWAKTTNRPNKSLICEEIQTLKAHSLISVTEILKTLV